MHKTKQLCRRAMVVILMVVMGTVALQYSIARQHSEDFTGLSAAAVAEEGEQTHVSDSQMPVHEADHKPQVNELLLHLLTLSPEYPRDGLVGSHPRRNCCGLIARAPLERTCRTYGSSDKPLQDVKGSTSCSCVDYLLCRLVVVTAISSNHFEEGRDMLASIQHNLPSTKIIVYDLGLIPDQQEDVADYCNTELRLFDRAKYPGHAKDLHKYAWKPIVTAEVAREYEVVLYGDASLRVFPNFAESLLPSLLDFPYASGPPQSFPIVSLTHDSTLKYLRLGLSRQDAVKELQFSLNAVYCFWLTDDFRARYLNHWIDCALHEDCIAPAGTFTYPCSIRDISREQGQYAGCHRFDRSASSIILYREFGREVLERFSDNELTRDPGHSSWTLKSSVSHYYDVMTTNCVRAGA